jgi:hypothetical protein
VNSPNFGSSSADRAKRGRRRAKATKVVKRVRRVRRIGGLALMAVFGRRLNVEDTGPADRTQALALISPD